MGIDEKIVKQAERRAAEFETTGSWEKNKKGWRYLYQENYLTSWALINDSWYFFGMDGYMKTGWIHWNEKDYFCDETGAMLVNTVTPDGASVGEDGARL